MESYCEICGKPLHKFIYEKQSYRFYKCDSCSHVQILPLPSESDLERAYQDGFGSSSTATDIEKMRRFARAHRNELPQRVARKVRLNKSAYILDIGCSYGYDLFRFKELGFQNVFGMELSEKAREIAKRAFDVPVYTSLDAIAEKGMSFDFVYLKHNLEHHRQPRETLQKIEKLLSPGAKLLIGVPNRHSINARWGKRWEWVTPPIHIHYFSKRSLRGLLELQPFKTEAWFSERGHGMPTFKHFLFFTPGLNQIMRKLLGDPYSPSTAPHRNLRFIVEKLSAAIANTTKVLSKPLKSLFFMGEEIWWLGSFEPNKC